MGFERPLTIKEVVDNIHRKKYLLPAIQREFVWKVDQIENLFDSLMQEYPVGSFLFWNVGKDKSKEYQFYEFLRVYHERDNRHNPNANINGDEDVVAVLDGQQRLTSLYIGLKGTYTYRLPRKHKGSVGAYPERWLYLNLLSPSSEFDKRYNFEFLTEEQASERDDDTYWYKVSDILDINEHYELNQYLIENGLNTFPKEKALFANKTLFQLHKVIHTQPSINYYLEPGQELDKVLNIFIRVNSGGTKLSYSDLLLSIATAQWKEKDARKEITTYVDEINRIGSGFSFDKDFVLKSCLVLSDLNDIAFKVDNFTVDTMTKIESNWENIKQSIRTAVTLVSSFGYSQETLTSNYTVIPIAYYVLKRGLPPNFVDSSTFKQDRQTIRKWLVRAILKRSFSGQPDNVLRPIRKILMEHNSYFPITQIIEEFRGSLKSFTFDDDEIDGLLSYEYGKSHTFSILSALYPTLDYKNHFHQDHIFPKSLFTKKRLLDNGIPEDKQAIYFEKYNHVVNLQLLEGVPNQEKSDTPFDHWIEETFPDELSRRAYMERHYIPDVDFALHHFGTFVENRRELMFNELKNILS